MRKADVNQWIAEVANGKKFADIGGLWGTKNEKVSVAVEAGASSVAMIDVQPLGNEGWKAFNERIRQRGIHDCRTIHADALSPSFSADVGGFDVVHCSGVLYHLPSPYHLLSNLKKISSEYIIVVSMTVPDIIENDAGKIELGGGKSLFLPSIDEKQRAIVRRHCELLGLNAENICDFPPEELCNDRGLPNYGPWWFLMTTSFILGMARTLRLEVVDYGEVWKDRATGFLFKR